MLVVLLQTSTLVYAQEGNDGQKVKLFRNGKVTHQLTMDSVTVAETVGPVIPGKNCALIYYDFEVGKNKLVLNGIEKKLTVPDDPDLYILHSIIAQGQDVYVLGVKYYKDGKAEWTEGEKYVIWKNYEFLYSVTDIQLIQPHAKGFRVDGNDIYIWGYSQSSLDAPDGSDRGFYIKNQENARVSNVPFTGFDVSNGDKYAVYSYRGYFSYHSTDRFYSNFGQIWRMWHNGDVTDIQRGDRSKLAYVNDLVLFNNVPYAIGYTQILTVKNGKGTESWYTTYSIGNQSFDIPFDIPGNDADRSEGLRIRVDDQGNVYMLTSYLHRTLGENNKDVYRVLKNGAKLYELEVDKKSIYGDTGNNNVTNLYIDGTDVYVMGGGYNYENDVITCNFYLWKNGEPIWSSGNRSNIVDMVIY